MACSAGRLMRLALFLLAGPTVAAQAAEQDRDLAHFIVRDHAVTAGIPAFGATIGAIGNGARLLPNGGFEPIILRDMFLASGGDADRIIAPAERITNFDTWRAGALDGAEVEVLRVENGAFRSLRRDRVARNGHHASGWIRLFPDRIVPAKRREITFSLPDWFRDAVPVWLTLRSVDADGRMSLPAAAVSVRRDGPARRTADRPPQVEARTISGTDAGLAPPSGLAAAVTEDGVIRLSWEPAPGAAGVAVFRSDQPPEAHEGYWLALERSGPTIRDGDLVVLRMKRFRADRESLLSNRAWGSGSAARMFRPRLLSRWSDDPAGGDWHLVRHEPATPVTEAGETFLRVSLGAGERFTLGRPTHSGMAQRWYPVLEPGRRYRYEVWVRGRANLPVRFEIGGFHARPDGGALRPSPFRITPDWRRYSGTFSVPVVHPGGSADRMQLTLSGPGTFDIDNFRVFAADAPYLALAPDDLERLETSRMSTLRTHAFVKTGRASYDLAQLTNPGGAINATDGGNTLPQTLAEIARLGMEPWLQVEPHLAPEEWLGLAEFLAAPDLSNGSTPWAAKRGGAPPWTGRFDRIFLEIGNETWNPLFAPWTFPPMTDAETGRRYSAGEVYGLYQEYVLSILRQSPHWPALADRLVPVISGRSGLGEWRGFDFGEDAARLSPGSRVLAHAGYIGGWDSDAGPARPDASGLARVLSHVLQTGEPLAARHTAAARGIAEPGRTAVVPGSYEAGPGYVLNGLNGRRMTPEEDALQERAMKSAAAGTAVLDSFLARARSGVLYQSYFSYGDGSHWASHSPWQLGGETLPAWDLLALFNRVGTGRMLDVTIMDAPRLDLPGAPGRQAVSGAPMVAAYATRSGDRLTLFLLSRRVPGHPDPDEDGTSRVLVDLPIRGARKVTQYWMSGPWNGHNLHERRVGIVATDVTDTVDLPGFRLDILPPAASVAIVFEGIR